MSAHMHPKSPAQIEAMRTGGRMLATILNELRLQTRPGITPKELSRIASQRLKQQGGEPAFLGYQGFPDVICISVNSQVQHSIPTATPLQIGDVVNLDFGVRYQGMITDGGITFCVGEKMTPDKQRLIEGTRKALEAGISKVKDGCRVGDISAAIEAVLRQHRLGIVRELVGHGVGYALHEEPEIPNYGLKGQGPVLRAGMTIAIEPIANLGGEAIKGDKDGWTLWTADGSDSAQFEHTVLVAKDGYEILTEA